MLVFFSGDIGFLLILTWGYVYWFERERKGGRDREREKREEKRREEKRETSVSQLVASHVRPNQDQTWNLGVCSDLGLNPQELVYRTMLQPSHPARVRHWFSNINLHGFMRSFPRYLTYSHDRKFSSSLPPSPSPVRWLCSQQEAESLSHLFNLGVACFGQWVVGKCNFLNIYIFIFQ